MKKVMFLLVFLMIQTLSLTAGRVQIETARIAATSFFTAHYARLNPDFTGIASVTETRTISRAGQPLYFIFNMSPCGWIAISGDDAAWPVLAYSFEGRYTGEDLPPQFVAWMKQYEDALFYFSGNPTDSPALTAKAWQDILDKGYVESYSSKSLSSIAPMLTSNWGQGLYFNSSCPADSKGPGGHTLVGCVPVAMGQIMNYYRWPVTGTGSYSYTNPPYGVLTANFGATTYLWDNMPNTLNRPNEGIPALLAHLGISCDLVYGPSSSGMYNHKAAYSLRTYFKYSPQTQYLFRDSTNLRWDSVIVAHLNRAMPLYYAGWSVPNINGHAFVCDGYQDTTYFHFNFGWNGSSNGYFYSGNPSPPTYNFQLAQELIINCFPDTVNYTYPTYCEGNKTINYFDALITDGSGPAKPYSTTADCSWLISPQTSEDSVSSIDITFSRLSTNPSDLVMIYDGPTTASPLLGSFSGTAVPPVFTSTGNKVLVKFKANGGTPGNGFKTGFSARLPVWCNGTTTTLIQGDTAEFNNGSYGFNYSNNTNCKWKLLRNDTLPLTIYFKYFDTEPGVDNLTIYDLGAGIPIDTISGHYDSTNLPAPVTSHSGKMFLSFTTNSSITGKGWEIYYPKKNTGITETADDNSLVIYPNPASVMVSLRFTALKASQGDLLLSSTDGRPLLHKNVTIADGLNTIRLNVSGFNAGLYFISLKTNNSVFTGKLIICKQ